ncbi:hypothetical protein B296_00058424, partial [Ensete ventricosum]
CGRKQSGDYLDGIAPDGLLGLGFGDISVPSSLARTGLIRNSFSLCFRDDDSGRILFGDRGLPTQQSTPFVPLDGKYDTYIIAVESFCMGSSCPGKTSFHALIDSGSSFTFLPNDIYKRVTLETGHHDLDNSRRMPLGSPPHDGPENPLPTNEQHSFPNNARVVSPAVAGRALPAANSSSVSQERVSAWYSLSLLLTQLAVFAIG